MQITLLSILTPYKENYNGTSALPYHLMVHRPKNVDITIYSFNNNHLPDDKIKETETELNVIIKKIKLPKWFLLVFKFHLLFIRLFLKYPIHHYIKVPSNIVNEIKQASPNGIWVYGAELSRVVKQFDGFKCVHTLPDSEALYYHRMMGTRFVFNSPLQYWKCAFMYRKFRRMENDFSEDQNVWIHTVGDADAKFIKDMNPKLQVKFIRHPHYETKTSLSLSKGEDVSLRRFHTPIRLLIAGQYNYYMKQDADQLISELKCNNSRIQKLKNNYSLTFLGKGWEEHVAGLKNVGWNVNHIAFAPDYIEEIAKHNIQISPISIGTGTKGKVLDALANGLLVIGSEYAMENIAVENGKSTIVYQQPEDVPEILEGILSNIPQYEQMAMAGMKNMEDSHGRNVVSKELFQLFD